MSLLYRLMFIAIGTLPASFFQLGFFGKQLYLPDFSVTFNFNYTRWPRLHIQIYTLTSPLCVCFSHSKANINVLYITLLHIYHRLRKAYLALLLFRLLYTYMFTDIYP
jgi:hypothetical protein